MSDSDEAHAFGWALRINGSCLSNEVDCGETVAPYRVCCPHGSFCPHADNVACCPSESNCTDALQAKPVCANSTWDLYINGGYFCCEQGTTAYAKDGGSDGCGIPGYKLQDDETKLDIISSASASSSTTPTATPTSSPTTTPSVHSDHNSSSSNTGAIAGGVVGGVVGAAILAFLVWFLLRRSRRLQRQHDQPTPSYQAVPYHSPQQGGFMPVPQDYEQGQSMSELESRDVQELAGGPKDQPAFELSADSHR